jgi:hypothetical protein
MHFNAQIAAAANQFCRIIESKVGDGAAGYVNRFQYREVLGWLDRSLDSLIRLTEPGALHK